MGPEKQQSAIQAASSENKNVLRQEEDIGLNPVLADYLLQRHGTVDLDPLPSLDPLDPLNWPAWRKNIYLALFAFHGMMGGYVAAGLVPALPIMAENYGVSLSAATYLVSVSVRSTLQHHTGMLSHAGR